MINKPFQNRNDVLVAIMKDKKDFALLHNELWYRIPVKTAPDNIKNGDAEIIAFYQTAIFKDDKWKVEWYGRIKNKRIVSREELFPDEPLNNIKSGKMYYRIELERLEKLPNPIYCRLARKISFIQTTNNKFLHAPEINYLFNDSPLEDIIFEALNEHRIPNERQWEVKIKGKTRFLDFAVQCNANDIAIECDGNAFHDSPKQVHNDKQRDNELKSMGWSVMRFTSEAIYTRLDEQLHLLKEAINRQGGLKSVNEASVKYIRTNNQLGLFDL
jgi:very-short-patch-repair endonuclease